MNKQPCELIQDILPLYVEDSVSNKTMEIVNDHLQECPTCQELCDELKVPDLVLPDLKESLPEVDTFKWWLKRLKGAGVLGLVLIILAGIGIGVLSYKAGSSVEKDILSARDVAKTLEQAGLILDSDSNVNPADYKIGQAEPSIYKVNNLDGVLFIYHFASVGERDTTYHQWEETNRKNNSGNNTNNFSERWQYNIAFGAKNTLLVMSLSQFSSEEYAQKISPVITNLGKAIFYDLNGGQQIVFQGEGENWKGKVIINYYNHFWTDDKGVIRYDGWSHKQPVLEFKGDPSGIRGNFSYEFESPFGEFGGTNSDGFDAQQFRERDTSTNYGGVILGFGTVGGDGAIPQKDSVYTLTLKWNDKQETVVLKATE
ncbi:hypothetical protein UF75_0262 [Desulfosporosinus sp. I2]|uniref:zf-HC2 domain-containing protein n=1 Tax=Desulfosporosinus sp. I2 TaxID=1617025 RepID=UPI00061E9AF8|nr:zf-HC2 domain-containing protein [Desulfosporosinus sp. I2]KJR49422.1 hypothetical protein UF75_0262 [Desulfosporosinus sp. I2]